MTSKLLTIWSRLGVGFGKSFSCESSLDLEQTLIETAREGRDSSRLLFGMRGWLLKHHDLVNVARLIRLVKAEDDTAVLGAILESIVEEFPRSLLLSVVKYCKKTKKKKFVFTRIEKSKIFRAFHRRHNLEIWNKWNLISAEMDDERGAIFEKSYVFEHNQNLLLRALFSPGIRAEVLSYFFDYKEGNAHQIAQQVGLSYEPVYSELKACEGIGLVRSRKQGRAVVYSLHDQVHNLLAQAFLQAA
ncbi:MAG: hypothetical protein COV43_07770 [Deltaproteobacteria bacterium CG11_big_fil_rev_8_21_14_0_20_42_23]|nr:MAG: hypothetical protein COV43_07770 [Deltaproteobacteria bacterium CG11_big_fil_rev_8_21_14_0_20_42_23]PJC63449.1 MAG: hypothetical protein CO021_09390 [Deltaproteobacteria bacterium CG_4_9_14_0_2_um_filter_42_21]